MTRKIISIVALAALSGIFLLIPAQPVAAGFCGIVANGTVNGNTANINVRNVGNSRILVEVTGQEDVRYEVEIDGSKSSGKIREDYVSRKVSRTYTEDRGTVKVRISSSGGQIAYAVAVVDCNDQDGSSSGNNIELWDPGNYDGRVSGYGTFGAAYVNSDGAFVYRIGEDSKGYLMAAVRPSDLEGLPERPEENIPLSVSADGRFAIYKLTSGEYQINIGPDDEGKVEVIVFSNFEETDETVRRTEFILPVPGSIAQPSGERTTGGLNTP